MNCYIHLACKINRNVTLSKAVRQVEMEMIALSQGPAVLA